MYFMSGFPLFLLTPTLFAFLGGLTHTLSLPRPFLPALCLLPPSPQDLFHDRCVDLIEFVRIVSDFIKLEKIYLGNTKGAVLTGVLRTIHEEFMTAMAAFRAAPYDVADVRRPEFDAHFFAFKTTIQQLEPRLAATVVGAFEDCPTVTGCFKTLECFEVGVELNADIHTPLSAQQSIHCRLNIMLILCFPSASVASDYTLCSFFSLS